jgi:hypothetical protein
MTDPTSQNTPAAPSPGWRFRVGVALIAVGFLSPLGALLVPFTDLSMGMKATLSGALIAGIPELFTVAAVAMLGKAGFNYVKHRIMAMLRRYGPPKEVGPVRYYLGLVMWLIPALYAWVLMYTPHDMIPGFPEYQIHIGLTFDFIFAVSFFVLGGDFWDKLRALFVHKAKASFPDAAGR